MYKKGFTLIELLVVVLIVGILAAIALPHYTFAVEKSRVVEVVSNIKVLGAAVDRHILATGNRPASINDLDIALNWTNINDQYASNGKFVYYMDDSTLTACKINSDKSNENNIPWNGSDICISYFTKETGSFPFAKPGMMTCDNNHTRPRADLYRKICQSSSSVKVMTNNMYEYYKIN
jgi:prepilin-type N-terminal cleavage/methylation domain-containing protein